MTLIPNLHNDHTICQSMIDALSRSTVHLLQGRKIQIPPNHNFLAMRHSRKRCIVPMFWCFNKLNNYTWKKNTISHATIYLVKVDVKVHGVKMLNNFVMGNKWYQNFQTHQWWVYAWVSLSFQRVHLLTFQNIVILIFSYFILFYYFFFNVTVYFHFCPTQ